MERPSHDHRLLKAARSLHHARQREAVLQGRIETAEGTLTEWMLASGTTQALLGLFELGVPVVFGQKRWIRNPCQRQAGTSRIP